MQFNISLKSGKHLRVKQEQHKNGWACCSRKTDSYSTSFVVRVSFKDSKWGFGPDCGFSRGTSKSL